MNAIAFKDKENEGLKYLPEQLNCHNEIALSQAQETDFYLNNRCDALTGDSDVRNLEILPVSAVNTVRKSNLIRC